MVGLAIFHFYQGLLSNNDYAYEFQFLGAILPLAVNPSLLLYTYSRFGALKWNNLFHFFPFFFFAIYFFLQHNFNSYQVPLESGAFINRDNFLFYNELYILSAAFYPTYAFYILKKKKANEKSDEKWLYYLVFSLIVVFVSAYIFTIIVPKFLLQLNLILRLKFYLLLVYFP